MHKTLTTCGAEQAADLPGPGKDGVERWLAGQVLTAMPSRVLDIGCGFGSLLATLRATGGCEAIGLNAALFPVEFGNRFWRLRNPEIAPSLRQGEFGMRLNERGFDAIIALESIGYTQDLPATLSWITGMLNPGGRVWLLDDWRHEKLANNDSDLRSLLKHWRRSQLFSIEDVIRAACDQGLKVHRRQELTLMVPAAEAAPGVARRRLLSVLHRLGGEGRVGELAAAFLGGWHLENLYARGVARYELILLQWQGHG
jgi:SAM-dependent methyltransferase